MLSTENMEKLSKCRSQLQKHVHENKSDICVSETESSNSEDSKNESIPEWNKKFKNIFINDFFRRD